MQKTNGSAVPSPHTVYIESAVRGDYVRNTLSHCIVIN